MSLDWEIDILVGLNRSLNLRFYPWLSLDHRGYWVTHLADRISFILDSVCLINFFFLFQDFNMQDILIPPLLEFLYLVNNWLLFFDHGQLFDNIALNLSAYSFYVIFVAMMSLYTFSSLVKLVSQVRDHSLSSLDDTADSKLETHY